MTITQITVSASTSFNHPHEQYANFKPGVTLTATINEAHENFVVATKELQHVADNLVAEEKARILGRINLEHEIAGEETAIHTLQGEEQSLAKRIAKRDTLIAKEWDGNPVEYYTGLLGPHRIESKEALDAAKRTAAEEREDMLEELKGTQHGLAGHTAKLAALKEKLLTLK